MGGILHKTHIKLLLTYETLGAVYVWYIGTLTTGASDFLYDGDWLEDRRTGRGHCTIRGRETYIGEWAGAMGRV